MSVCCNGEKPVTYLTFTCGIDKASVYHRCAHNWITFFAHRLCQIVEMMDLIDCANISEIHFFAIIVDN